ncbi:fibronectin type III domain-containing protein [Sporanaerobium hydrogeniformans]|uniref:fibronectin type III domain-containing protein n=1 Tax=Sporanaerobium hydrogeniformans TaxID=3072179 RepID=UPI0015D4D64E|nr:fibronectin type III domain-containing protein [Sporanaerobium hydrogeniformans]
MSKFKTNQRLTVMMMSVIMTVGMTSVSATAETVALPIGITGEILSFEPLPKSTTMQSVSLGTLETDLDLPNTLNATVSLVALEKKPVLDDEETYFEKSSTDMVTGSAIDIDEIGEMETNGNKEDTVTPLSDTKTTIPVTWISEPVYDKETAGTYSFTPNLPEGYALADEVELPQIHVTVELVMQLALTSTDADYSWYDANPTATEFEIGSAAQLKGLADIVNGTRGSEFDFSGKTIKLTTDISLSKYTTNWTPIGGQYTPFAGSFIGNFHTISSFTINSPSTNYVGLFGNVTGSISDLLLTTVNVTGYEHVGALAGQSLGNITHCAVIGGTVRGNYRVGGLVGKLGSDYNSGNTIAGSFTTCNVTLSGSSPANAGGIVGSLSGNVINCYSTGSVSAPNYSSSYGGIVGSAHNGSSIKSCFATGTVSGYINVGGIVGFISGNYNTPSEIRNCAALNSQVSGNTSAYGGPKVGQLAGAVDDWYIDITDVISFSGMTKTGDGGNDGEEKTATEIKAMGFFEAQGFSLPAWEVLPYHLPILLGFPEGLQQGELPLHLSPILPTAPRNLTAAHGDKQVTISWNVPMSVGESSLLRYEVKKDNEAWIPVDKSLLTYTFTGLTNGTIYTFRVRAVNSNGIGSESAIRKPPGKKPSAPLTVAVTPSVNKLTITWTQPLDLGTGGVEYYELTLYTNSSVLSVCVEDAFLHEFSGISDTSSYQIVVCAVNSFGSSESLFISSGSPSPPQNFTVVPGSGKVTLSWSKPASTGKSPIMDYHIYNPLNNTWFSVGPTFSYVYSGLTNGEPYRFQVRARNTDYTYGESAASMAIPREAPQILNPSNLNLTYGSAHVFGMSVIGTPPFTYTLSPNAPTGVSIEDTGSLFFGDRIPAGTHNFTIMVSNGALTHALQNFTLTVTKYTPRLSDLQFKAVTDRVYDGTNTGIGAVTDTKGMNLPITVYYVGVDGTIYPKSTTPPRNVGNYNVIADISGDANVNAASIPLVTYSILPNPVTVTPVPGQSKIYGQTDPALQYTLSPTLASGDFLTGSLTRVVGENTGTYAILLGTLTGGSNYRLTFRDGIHFSIKPKSSATFAIGDIPNQTYSGSAFTPEPEVKDHGKILVKGIDFIYSYENNINAGASATVQITGIGNYAGSTGSKAFTIHKAAGTFVALPEVLVTYAPMLKLGDISLPAYYEWSNPSTVLHAGNGQRYQAIYTDPSKNYDAATGDIIVNVAKASGIFVQLPPISATYTPILKLGNISLPEEYDWVMPSTSLVTGDNQSYEAIYTHPSGNYEIITGNITVNVEKALPPISLSTNPKSTQIRPGSVELIAVVPGDATGTLTFKTETNILTTVTLPANTATFTPTSASNTCSFTVEYSGNSNYNGVTSTAIAYSFIKSDQVALDALDGTINYGDTLELSALVSGGSGTGAFSFTVIDGPGEINGTLLNSTGVGEVEIAVTKMADNDYNAQSATFKVKVNPRIITFTVAPVEKQIYTGSTITPMPHIMDGTMVLTEGTHFTYVYHNNTHVGTSATINAIGIGNYEGSMGFVTFTIGGATPHITMPPTVSSIVYTGTALSQISLIGGEASVSGHFEWVNPWSTAVYGLNTFEARFVPDDSVLYTQISGLTITFNAVSHSSGENSSSQDPIIVPSVKPNQPSTDSAIVTAQVINNNAIVTITDSIIKAAIEKALGDAKVKNNTTNEVSVDIPVSATKATSFSITLERAALMRLLNTGVKSFSLSSLPVNMSFDSTALKQIQVQSNSDVTISIKSVTVPNLRNTFDITLRSIKDGKNVNITSLETGTSTLGISTTPDRNEFIGYLYGVYIGADKKINRIADSAYDTNSRRMLLSTNHFSVYGVSYIPPSTHLTDIKDHWAKDSIDYVVGRGLLVETTETTFLPNMAMTRGMLVTALGRLAGIDTKAYTGNNFVDIKEDSSFHPYIEWAYKKNIIQGMATNQFAPDRAVTREEIAMILQNYAKATGYKLSVNRNAVTFVDASSIDNAYKTAVTLMQQAGIMMGDDENRFHPKSNATRAEVASMLHRYIKLTIDPATTQGWAKNDTGQYLYYKDGKALIGTQIIDGMKYFFENTGILKDGWVKDGNKWRYYSGNKIITNTNAITSMLMNLSLKAPLLDETGIEKSK